MEKAKKKIVLRSPAGNLDSLKRAIGAGADAVYIGFQSETNLRNFPGLNFSHEDALKGVQYAHEKEKEVYITINTYPQDSQLQRCFEAVDIASSIKADAIIATDIAVMDFIRKKYPYLNIHLSVQAGVSNSKSINFYKEKFGISCVILPRFLNLDEIKRIREYTDIELEVFVFGSLCANHEGRCNLSSYITGESCNSKGACAPAEFVQLDEDKEGNLIYRLNNKLLNKYEDGEIADYPTPCKSRLKNPITGQVYYAFQDSVSLNTISILPRLAKIGVDAIKIEGRQRTASYAEGVTRIFRSAIDGSYIDEKELTKFIEGAGCTLGYLAREGLYENFIGAGSA
jgi:putative protease